MIAAKHFDHVPNAHRCRRTSDMRLLEPVKGRPRHISLHDALILLFLGNLTYYCITEGPGECANARARQGARPEVQRRRPGTGITKRGQQKEMSGCSTFAQGTGPQPSRRSHRVMLSPPPGMQPMRPFGKISPHQKAMASFYRQCVTPAPQGSMLKVFVCDQQWGGHSLIIRKGPPRLEGKFWDP